MYIDCILSVLMFVSFNKKKKYTHKTVLLGAASQRIEYLALEFIGTPWLLEILADWKKHERGALPGIQNLHIYSNC